MAHGLDVAPDHESNEFGLGGSRHVLGGDVSAISQDGHPICDLGQLRHAMTDVHDSYTRCAQCAHDREQLLEFVSGKHGRWLIEDDNSGVVQQCSSDLHSLLLGNNQLFHPSIQRQLDTHTFTHGDCALPLRTPVDEPSGLTKLSAKKQILEHRQGWHQTEFLVDDRHASLSCFAR
jgi:hypothetical protein